MATKPLSKTLLLEMVNVLAKHDGNQTRAAESLGIPRNTFTSRIHAARQARIDPTYSPPPPPAPAASSPAHDLTKQESLRNLLRRGTHSISALCDRLSASTEHVMGMLQALRSQGFLVTETSEGYTIHITPPPAILTEKHQYLSRPGGYYKFGYTSDNHLCSKYAREDVLNDLYDWFAAEGVDRVINTGNYIDGEFRFNRHDIHTHGMQNQLNYFCERYPKRVVVDTIGSRSMEGWKEAKRREIITYIISGDDHEGWYGQREGVDIGWLMEQTAKDKYQRNDLVNLGYMEAFIRLMHADHPNAQTHILAAHPGGGSAYALSYAAQKYVEALQGGEKPAVILFGHWHKMFDLVIRNVICLGGGCTKDLDPFGRKNKLAYHVGGMIVELWQDSIGAIPRWRVEKKQYFDRGYYNDQWSYTGMPGKVPV